MVELMAAAGSVDHAGVVQVEDGMFRIDGNGDGLLGGRSLQFVLIPLWHVRVVRYRARQIARRLALTRFAHAACVWI